MNDANRRIMDIAAVILAGGKSKRMGRDKLALKIADKTLLQDIVGRFEELFETTYLSLADPNKYPEVKIERITDFYPNQGPLGGVHAGLKTIAADDSITGIFVIAADLPYVNEETARIILDEAKDCDVCVPIDKDGRFEPLFAYYSKANLVAIEKLLDVGNNKVIDFYSSVNVKSIDVSRLFKASRNDLFFNVNRPDDYMIINGK